MRVLRVRNESKLFLVSLFCKVFPKSTVVTDDDSDFAEAGDVHADLSMADPTEDL
jgi:hypothetical protein